MQFHGGGRLVRKVPDMRGFPHLQKQRERDQGHHPADDVHQAEILIIRPVNWIPPNTIPASRSPGQTAITLRHDVTIRVSQKGRIAR